jgi:toxin ParE1/3/4
VTEYVLSPRARADLDDIWDYSVVRWGVVHTERYQRGLWHAIQICAADPQQGRDCGDIRAGYYRYPVGSHVLFYRLTATGIDVVRILHQRMDFERHL